MHLLLCIVLTRSVWSHTVPCTQPRPHPALVLGLVGADGSHAPPSMRCAPPAGLVEYSGTLYVCCVSMCCLRRWHPSSQLLPSLALDIDLARTSCSKAGGEHALVLVEGGSLLSSTIVSFLRCVSGLTQRDPGPHLALTSLPVHLRRRCRSYIFSGTSPSCSSLPHSADTTQRWSCCCR